MFPPYLLVLLLPAIRAAEDTQGLLHGLLSLPDIGQFLVAVESVLQPRTWVHSQGETKLPTSPLASRQLDLWICSFL